MHWLSSSSFCSLCLFCFIVGTLFPGGDIWGARALPRGEKKTRNPNSLITLTPPSRTHLSLHGVHTEYSKEHEAQVTIHSKLMMTEVGLYMLLVGQKTILTTSYCFPGGLSVGGQRWLHACGVCAHVHTHTHSIPFLSFQKNLQCLQRVDDCGAYFDMAPT